MRLRSVAFLCVLFSLAATGVAPAAVVLDIRLVYERSYNLTGGTTTLPNYAVTDGNVTVDQISVAPGSEWVNHQFGMYVTVSGLTADQDLAYFQFKPTKSTGVTLGSYTANSYIIDPPSMGSPASDAPAASWDYINLFSGTSYSVDVLRGDATSPNTYGDYAAYLQLGEASPFKIGSQIVTSSTLGTFGFQFAANPGKVKIISGNTNGAALDASYESYPSYTGINDTVLFAPRIAADLTWANGTATASTWAVANGAQHFVQTAAPTVRDDFYHGDTVRFTSNSALDRTVTLVGSLNPASVVVDSSDDYVFNGAGRIVGSGTTLVKRGSGKLTVSNTTPNTYTGLTTVEGGTLQLGAAAQATVLANGADVQNDWSKLVFEYNGTTSPADSVKAALKASYDTGWAAVPGAISSATCAADSSRALGWLDDGTIVTVMQTKSGDCALDGYVGFDDLTTVLAHYDQEGWNWAGGDFGYDDYVGFDDLTKVLAYYDTGLPPIVEAQGLDAAAIGLLASHGVTVVPEPGTLALLASGLVGLLAYAWRRRK
jgi:autotransporter-associated beta strand protein